MSCDTKFLKSRFEVLKADRTGIEQAWEQVEKFVSPLGGVGSNQGGPTRESEVGWQRQEIWDFTAIDGCQKLAASIHGSVTSPAIRWFRLTFRSKELAEDTEAASWLDKVSDIAFETIQDSDFNTEVASGYIELVGAGTMALVVEPTDELKWEGLDFTVVPIREVHFEEDPSGGVQRFFRDFSWTASQIVEKFDESKTPLPEFIRVKANTPSGGTDRIKVVFCIYDRETDDDLKLDSDTPKFPLPPEKRPYGFVYFLAETGEQLGDEGGYYECPVFITRWERTAGSRWGHGPGIVCLPTVKYTNSLMELVKNAMAVAIDPPRGVTERGLLSDLQGQPGGLTVVRSRDDIFPLVEPLRADVAMASIEDLRHQIRQLFHTDELQLKESPAMTATEVQVRYELMNRVMGSTLARIQSDFLSPMLQAVVAMLYRAGQLPKMPESVKRGGGATVIEYQGPLSRAQRTDEVAAIERLAAYVAGLAKLFPEVSDIFDPNQAVRNIAKRLGVPADCLASEATLLKKKREREQLQKQLAQAETARAQGEAAQQQADAVQSMQAAQQAGPIPVPPPPLTTPPVGGQAPNAYGGFNLAG